MTLDRVVNLLATVAIFEMMATAGLGVELAEIAGVARNWRLVIRGTLANYVVFPAATLGLLLAFQSPSMVCAGFLIAAAYPGAPFGPPLTALARGNVVLSVGLMVLLAGSSALAAPILLGFLLPITAGDAPIQVSVSKLVGTLFVAQFLPLCIGLGIRRRRPVLADRLKTPPPPNAPHPLLRGAPNHAVLAARRSVAEPSAPPQPGRPPAPTPPRIRTTNQAAQKPMTPRRLHAPAARPRQRTVIVCQNDRNDSTKRRRRALKRSADPRR